MPQTAEAGVKQALALWQSGRRQEAQSLCETLSAATDDADALSLLADIQTATGRPEYALQSLLRLARARSTDAAVHRRLGDALLAVGAFPDAVESYRRSLQLEPHNVRGHNNLGQALMRLGRFGEARASYERAVELDPRYAIAHHNLGNALQKLDQLPAALAAYDDSLRLQPTLVEALFARGNVLQGLQRFQEAVENYQQVLALAPAHAQTLSNCGNALLLLKRPEEALTCCEQAIQLKPDLVEAYNNLGGALRKLNRLDEALAACQRAVALRPDDAGALSNSATIMLACNRFEDAIGYCDRALALQPGLVEAHERRGAALLGAKRPQEAAGAYDEVVTSDPHFPFALGATLSARLACCDWMRYSELQRRIEGSIEAGELTIQPFALLAISESPQLQLGCARTYVEDQFPARERGAWIGRRYQHDKIRVAYLSGDYHEHATAMLMAGLFEAHDRSRFQTVAVSFAADDSSPMRRRLEQAFDRFIDVRGSSDAQVREALQSLEIDIAVDLKGHTGESRPGILARRAAPVQVCYLGYPGTTGLETLDYVLADPIVLPAGQQAHYTERIVHLPESYQVNDDRRVIAASTPTRLELGLPPRGFVFCCFNNHYKITPTIFDVWMGLLQRVPDSVLWLLEDNGAAADNLRREAVSRGVNPERLVFAARVSADVHLARHRQANLFLDTLPYNAHTTTSDALWAGLPVLTCLGKVFPGRVAASLLHAVGLPELVVESLQQYTELAVELARNPSKLDELRARLERNRRTHPLFDTARFCRHLESAYTMMWQRYQDGLPVEGFAVAALPRG
jgi:predicted O-linked N-acetylglucosamine transferase (SPINDLY family)